MPIEIAAPLEAGFRLWQSKQFEAAQAQLRVALARAEAARNIAGELGARQLLGDLAHDEGDLAAAWHHHSYVLELSRSLGLRLGMASALHNLGLIAAQENNLLVAHSLLGAAIATYESLGRPESVGLVRANLAHFMSGPAA
jgi:hypothetical protein